MNESLFEVVFLSLSGMMIVFTILAFIALIVSLIGYFDRDWKTREHRQKEQALENPQTIDDLTLVLISAAVATIIKGRHRIRSITRVRPGAGGSVWSIQGRSTLLGSHVLPKGKE